MTDHNEFERIRKEALAIVDTAKAQARGLTTTERKSLDDSYARMSAIREGQQLEKMADDSAASQAISIATRSYRRDDRAPLYDGGPLVKGDKIFSKLGMTAPSVSLGRFLRATVLGPRNDAERFALQNGSDSTGGFDLPAPVAAQFIDGFRAESAYVGAGALVLPLTDRQKASRVTDPTATWRAEDAAVTTAQPFASVDLDPKSLSVIVRVSREQLEDSINVESELERTLVSAMAKAADAAIGFGNGGVEPLGIANTPGVLAIASTTNGTALSDYSTLLAAVYQLQSNDANPTAAIVSPREAQKIGGFVDTTNQPLRRPDSLSTLPLLVSAATPINQTQGTSSAASTMIVGDFSRLLIAVRVGLRIEVLKERYADFSEYGFQATLRLDSTPTRVKSFCKVSGIIA